MNITFTLILGGYAEKNENLIYLYLSDDEDPDSMAKTDKEKAEAFANFFSSVMTKEMDGVWNLTNKPEIKQQLQIDITEDIVLKKTIKIKDFKVSRTRHHSSQSS